jgi:putative toxin-antitoxin system antitoxin component (TIGR02293 family)
MKKASARRVRTAKATASFKTIVARSLDPGAAIEAVRQGLPASSIDEAVVYIDVPQKDLLAALRIPLSSYHRKLAANETLSSPESEKVVRLAEITRHAEQTFGDARTARDWLIAPNLALGASPLSLIDTETGAAQVRRVLGTLDYGGVA